MRYLELAAAYNSNVAKIDQLWSRANLEIEWVQQGRKQRESGEGHLMLVPPNRVALSMGKLGQTYFWAGCDPRQYWLFDLRDGGVAYVGSHQRYEPGRFRELPLSVRPLDVPKLLGLVYLPLDDVERDRVLVAGDGADWVIELPRRNARLWIDPATFTARRVQLRDEKDRVLVESILEQPVAVQSMESPARDGPKLPREATIVLPGESGRLRLQLSGLSDGRREQRLNPRQFDLQALLKAHKPARIVDLDEY